MSLPPHIRRSWRAAWPGALLAFLAGAVLLIFPAGNALRRWSYDLLVAAKPATRPSEVVLVYIDDLSHTRLAQPYDAPWDRTLDARLVERLQRLGAKAVGFDVLFDLPSRDPAADAQFATALRNFTNVVLGATLARGDYFGIASEIQLKLPITNLTAAAAGWGFVELPVDPDDMVRTHYAGTEEIPSLSWRMAMLLDTPVTRMPRAQTAERWMHYYAGGESLPGLSYFKVLEDSDDALADFFRGKVVIVGAGSKSGYTGKRKDQFRNPHTWLAGRFSPGAEVHATALLNLLHHDWLRRPAWWMELSLVALVGLGLPLWITRRTNAFAFAAALAVAVLICVGAWLWIALANVWCAWLIAVVVQIPVALGWALLQGAPHAEPIASAAETQDYRATTRPDIADYELLDFIGRGAYGEVWRARGVTGVLRAIKIVHRRGFAADRQFDREFQGVVNFEPVSRLHEGLVPVLHVGRNDAAGFFYYVMELADAAPLSGSAATNDSTTATYRPHTLAELTAQRKPVPARECLSLMIDLSSALAFLHERRLVHRDIKPANLIFTGGRLKLADIGLVAETSDAPSFVGTEGYISPEGPGTPQADVFSAGRVIYELLTGLEARWFPEQPRPVPETADPSLWHQLLAIASRACARDVSERFADGTALHAALIAIRKTSGETAG